MLLVTLSHSTRVSVYLCRPGGETCMHASFPISPSSPFSTNATITLPSHRQEPNTAAADAAIAEIQEWLLTTGRVQASLAVFTGAFADFLSRHVPLDRLLNGTCLLHPQVSAYSFKWERKTSIVTQGIGLHFGECSYGNVGGSDRLEQFHSQWALRQSCLTSGASLFKARC